MLNSQNLHTKFLSGYLTWSKYLGGTLFYYEDLSKKLCLIPWPWYRLQFQIRIKLAWFLILLLILESLHFHSSKKSKSSSHNNSMIIQLFYFGAYSAFTYANQVHWKKQKEICNLYNAMVIFERKYGMGGNATGKGFLFYTIWVMSGVMIGRILITFTFPCVLDVVGSSLIEECRLDKNANDLAHLTVSTSLDLIKLIVVTINYSIFGCFYPGFIAELVLFLYIPCVFLNMQLESARSIYIIHPETKLRTFIGNIFKEICKLKTGVKCDIIGIVVNILSLYFGLVGPFLLTGSGIVMCLTNGEGMRVCCAAVVFIIAALQCTHCVLQRIQRISKANINRAIQEYNAFNVLHLAGSSEIWFITYITLGVGYAVVMISASATVMGFDLLPPQIYWFAPALTMVCVALLMTGLPYATACYSLSVDMLRSWRRNNETKLFRKKLMALQLICFNFGAFRRLNREFMMIYIASIVESTMSLVLLFNKLI
ncbi:unnamed protein product [Orchesella dallaii]|uniref:Odorant receptor n=1 Tax=Orchesella dallaii TaxID=48710 RepID=A0ABP1RQF5_9HEXA